MDLNISNSIFEGFNDKNGLMICGYEHGHSKADQQDEVQLGVRSQNHDNLCTFSNQVPRYGEIAKTWKYQTTIKRWFKLWGFPLDEDGLGGKLEKSIVLTNWANTQGHNTGDKQSRLAKLLSDEQIDNFLHHISFFEPRAVFLMGTELIHCLNNKKVISRFENIMGKKQASPTCEPRPVGLGTRFKVYFQTFEKEDGNKCHVVCFPHPSGSRGLRDDYFAEYKNRVEDIISSFR